MKKASETKGAAKHQAEHDRVAAMTDEQIDTSDIPEVRDWRGAKRGKFFRPVGSAGRREEQGPK